MHTCFSFCKKNIYFAISFFCLTFYTFFFYHPDLSSIVYWGTSFLDCIFNHNLPDFQLICFLKNNTPSNYTVFINFINAIWLTPLYLIGRLLHHSFSIGTFAIYYKFFVYIIFIASISIMQQICNLLHLSEKQQPFLLAFLLSSPIVFLETAAKGQVDVLGNFFFLLAILCFLDKKYIKASLWIGISITIKPFAILFFIPALLLLLFREKFKILLYAICASIFPFINWVITHFYFHDYSYYKKLLEDNISKDLHFYYLENIYHISFAQCSVFLLCAGIICFACLYISEHLTVHKEYFILFPALLFLDVYVFLNTNGQWFLYLIFPLLYLCFLSKEKNDIYILTFLGGFSYMINLITRLGWCATSFMSQSGKLFSVTIPDTAHLTTITQTISVGCAILILFLLWRSILSKYSASVEPTEMKASSDSLISTKTSKLLLLLNILLPIIYAILNLVSLALLYL